MPIRLCLEARCPNPATARGRCDEHRKAREAERSQEAPRRHSGVYKTQAVGDRRRVVLQPRPHLQGV